MAKPLTEDERAAIIAALQAGESLYGVAKRTGRGIATVSAVAKAAGIESERSITKKATEVHQDYALAGRLDLLNQGFEKAASLLASITDATEFQRWTVGVGTLIDKRRLEDGDVTSRTETVGDDARDRVARKLDELAERRRAQSVA